MECVLSLCVSVSLFFFPLLQDHISFHQGLGFNFRVNEVMGPCTQKWIPGWMLLSCCFLALIKLHPSVFGFFKLQFVNSFMLHKHRTYSIRSFIYIYTVRQKTILFCIFWICIGVNVNSGNKMVIFWLKVWHQHNTDSNPPCFAVVLHSVTSEHCPPVEGNSLIWDVVVETRLCKDVDTTESDFMLFCQPVSHFSILFSCKWPLARSILYLSWITRTLFLPGAVELIRSDGQKMSDVIVSKSVALTPNPALSSPTQMQVFSAGSSWFKIKEEK